MACMHRLLLPTSVIISFPFEEILLGVQDSCFAAKELLKVYFVSTTNIRLLNLAWRERLVCRLGPLWALVGHPILSDYSSAGERRVLGVLRVCVML